MDIINQWAEMYNLFESQYEMQKSRRGNTSDDNVFGSKERFGTARPDELGAKIMHLFSPACFKEMREDDSPIHGTDFGCFITDKGGITLKYPRSMNKDKLGGGLIILMFCKKDSLDPKIMIDRLNKWCGSVLPKQFTEEDIIKLGSFDRSGTRHNITNDYDFYALNLTDSFSKTEVNSEDIKKGFDDVKGEYADADLQLIVDSKEKIGQYFRNNREGYAKLKDGDMYMLFFAFQGTMNKESISEVANKIQSQKKYTADNVLEMGSTRKKYSKTGKFDNFDMFVIAL